MKKLVLKYFLSTINNKIVLLTHDFRKFCKYMPKMCKYTPKLCKCTPKKSLKYRSKNSKASSLKESNFWNANIVKTNTHTHLKLCIYPMRYAIAIVVVVVTTVALVVRTGRIL